MTENTEELIKNLLDLRIRPQLQADGGDIVFHKYHASGENKGQVELELIGACVGCPYASETLKNIVEETLRYFIPEVTSVKDINKDE